MSRRQRCTLGVLAAVSWACAPDPAAGVLRAGDVLVVDQDAGARGADGERAGALFVVRGDEDGTPAVAHVLEDARWIEPADVLPRPGGDALLLESTSPHPDAPDARGAIHAIDARGVVTEWWRDARARQPVCLVAGDGVVYVSDRAADPRGLGRPTGCVFAIDADDPSRSEVLAAGPELETPGGLLVTRDGRLLLMDADADPHEPDGTSGVLFEVDRATGALAARLAPTETTSPIGLVERAPGELFLVDANAGREPPRLGDGALFSVELDDGEARITRRLDTAHLGARALVDPALACVLDDGRLLVADANADPLGRGDDGTGKGVYGTGPGCVVALDPDARTATTYLADPRFVTPVSVRRMPAR